MREWCGTNGVGTSMRDLIPPEAHERRALLLRHCLSEGAPAWFPGPMLVNKQPARHAGRLALPVSYRDETPGTRASVVLDDTRTCPRAELN